MRNVLIPTDFSVESLAMVDKTAQTLDGESLNIILFHAFEIPFYVSDIFAIRDKKLPYADLVTEAFRNACKRSKLQYSKTIRSIAIRHLYGSTNAVFRNFVDANDIDLIVCPDHYLFQPVQKDSVNPESMFRKAGVPLLKEFTWKQKQAAPVTQTETDLLNTNALPAKNVKTPVTTKEKEYAVKEEYTTGLHVRENQV